MDSVSKIKIIQKYMIVKKVHILWNLDNHWHQSFTTWIIRRAPQTQAIKQQFRKYALKP